MSDDLKRLLDVLTGFGQRDFRPSLDGEKKISNACGGEAGFASDCIGSEKQHSWFGSWNGRGRTFEKLSIHDPQTMHDCIFVPCKKVMWHCAFTTSKGIHSTDIKAQLPPTLLAYRTFLPHIRQLPLFFPCQQYPSSVRVFSSSAAHFCPLIHLPIYPSSVLVKRQKIQEVSLDRPISTKKWEHFDRYCQMG